MTTLKELKQGATLSQPIYVHKPYIVLGPQNMVLASGTLDEVKQLSSYYDECRVEIRQHDLYLNDNTKIPEKPQPITLTQHYYRVIAPAGMANITRDTKWDAISAMLELDERAACKIAKVTETSEILPVYQYRVIHDVWNEERYREHTEIVVPAGTIVYELERQDDCFVMMIQSEDGEICTSVNYSDLEPIGDAPELPHFFEAPEEVENDPSRLHELTHNMTDEIVELHSGDER